MQIELEFNRKKAIDALIKIGISPNSTSSNALEYFITEDTEKFILEYLNVKYEKGMFIQCTISESQNKIILKTVDGNLLNSKNYIMFSVNGKFYEFFESDKLSLKFIPS